MPVSQTCVQFVLGNMVWIENVRPLQSTRPDPSHGSRTWRSRLMSIRLRTSQLRSRLECLVLRPSMRGSRWNRPYRNTSQRPT